MEESGFDDECLKKDFSLDVINQQMYRARRKAMRLIEGDGLEQSIKLWDYTNMLAAENPSSIVKVEDERFASKRGRRRGFC